MYSSWEWTSANVTPNFLYWHIISWHMVPAQTSTVTKENRQKVQTEEGKQTMVSPLRITVVNFRPTNTITNPLDAQRRRRKTNITNEAKASLVATKKTSLPSNIKPCQTRWSIHAVVLWKLNGDYPIKATHITSLLRAFKRGLANFHFKQVTRHYVMNFPH